MRLGGLIIFDANDGIDGPQLWTMRVVDIADSTPPVLTCPPNQRLSTSGDGGVVDYAPATATDDNTPTPSLSYSIPSGSWFPIGFTAVQVTATDWGGNSSSCWFDVVVLSASSLDAGSPGDGGTQAAPRQGCGCESGASSLWLVPALVLLAVFGRSRRRA